MSNIIPFVARGHARTFRPELVLFDDRRRRQWAVTERGPDGSESYWPVYRGKRSEAVGLANILTRGEASRHNTLVAIASTRLGRLFLDMSSEEREFAARLLDAIPHLTGEEADAEASA